MRTIKPKELDSNCRLPTVAICEKCKFQDKCQKGRFCLKIRKKKEKNQ